MNIFKANNLLDGITTKKINGSGVNLKKFSTSKIEKDKLSFIFVGRLLKDKGIYEYIDAARIIKKKYPSAKFRVLGELDNNPSSLNADELNLLLMKKLSNIFLMEMCINGLIDQKYSFCPPIERVLQNQH